MGEDNALPKTFIELRGTAEGQQRTRSCVIAKLVGARCEVEDVLLSPNGSTVLLAPERVRLSILMVDIDDIVRRTECRVDDAAPGSSRRSGRDLEVERFAIGVHGDIDVAID